jgi:hypothetical protein
MDFGFSRRHWTADVAGRKKEMADRFRTRLQRYRHRCGCGEHSCLAYKLHLFDFVHGWLYILGAGIIGGMMHHGQSPINEPGRTGQE